MTSPLLVSRVADGTFRVTVPASAAEQWSRVQLHAFLVANGYTAHDADACVNEASVAQEIRIGLPA